MEEKKIKKLVIYYSFEGNTKLLAGAIAKEMDADLLQLKPVKELASKGFSKYLWGGSQVVMKKKPQLIPFEVNPLNYDLIVIGTPVWAWTYAPPLATFLSTVEITNKSIALFCCHGGQIGKTFINLKSQLNGNRFIGDIDFFEPLKKDQEGALKKAKEWAVDIVRKT